MITSMEEYRDEATPMNEEQLQAWKRAQVVAIVAERMRNGEVEPGYHGTCKHEDTPEARAECGVRRWEFEERRRMKDAPSGVCGRFGVYAYVSTHHGGHKGKGTYVRAKRK